jgi:hypothetical protein
MEPATLYTVDATLATVVFGASSSVHPVRSVGSASGWFRATIDGAEFVDTGEFDGQLEVPLAGLSSGSPLIDREMKRRFDSGTHPTIVATLESVVRADSRHATVTGTIEFLGASMLVEGELGLAPGPRLVGTGEFDVRWWGLEPPRMLMLRVDPIVTVDVDLPLRAAR